MEELLKKQSMAEEWTSSLTQYLNKCRDVLMDGPVFCLACQTLIPFFNNVKVTAEIFLKRPEHRAIAYPFSGYMLRILKNKMRPTSV